MMLQTRCTPELREAYFIGVSLLPQCKVGTPSIRRTREKMKSTGAGLLSFRWEPSLVAYTQLKADAFGKYTKELEEV